MCRVREFLHRPALEWGQTLCCRELLLPANDHLTGTQEQSITGV